MIVCSDIRSLEQELVAGDRVRILEQELLERGHGGKGLWCHCMSVLEEEGWPGMVVG